MEGKLIAVRLQGEQLQQLNLLRKMTGLSHSEIIRRLIDQSGTTTEKATVVNVSLGAKTPKGVALVAA